MRLSLTVGFLAAALVGVPPALAAGQTSQGVIVGMAALNGETRVETPAITSNPDGCSGTGYFVVTLDHPNYQTIVAMLIAAQHAGKQVFFYVDGCAIGYPKILNAYVVT